MFRLSNIRPGPEVSAIHGNIRVYGARNVSFLLTIKNKDMVSYAGTVTTNTGCSNST